MPFVRVAFAAFGVMIFITFVGLFSKDGLGGGLFPVVSLGGIGLLALTGFKMHRGGHVQLGAVALTVQGFGVFSLVLGLALGVSALVRGNFVVERGNFQEFAPMIWPIVEGFVSAGTATLIVVLLRLAQSVMTAPEVGGSKPAAGGASGGGGPGGGPAPEYAKVTAAVAALVTELERARAQASGMADTVTKLHALMNGLGTMLESLDRFFVEKV